MAWLERASREVEIIEKLYKPNIGCAHPG